MRRKIRREESNNCVIGTIRFPLTFLRPQFMITGHRKGIILRISTERLSINLERHKLDQDINYILCRRFKSNKTLNNLLQTLTKTFSNKKSKVSVSYFNFIQSIRKSKPKVYSYILVTTFCSLKVKYGSIILDRK